MSKRQTTDYITENFHGTVHLKDWIEGLDANPYKSVTGLVSIVRDVDLVGFESKGTESNWVARISDDTGEMVVTILGCQIRGITSHPATVEITSKNVWVL